MKEKKKSVCRTLFIFRPLSSPPVMLAFLHHLWTFVPFLCPLPLLLASLTLPQFSFFNISQFLLLCVLLF